MEKQGLPMSDGHGKGLLRYQGAVSFLQPFAI